MGLMWLRGPQSFDQSGLGAVKPAEVQKADSEYELYRKRMMLAYRFRPNPLVSSSHKSYNHDCVFMHNIIPLILYAPQNNPRRTYY